MNIILMMILIVIVNMIITYKNIFNNLYLYFLLDLIHNKTLKVLYYIKIDIFFY
jgi:hypothetical protein